MDTDEAGKHTQNILARVTRQQEVEELNSRLVEISLSKPSENPTEDTMEDSDMDTTVLDIINTLKRFTSVLRQDEGLVEPTGEMDTELQRSLAKTLRHGTPPPTLGISLTTTKLCTVPLSLFTDPERILRRLYVFEEEPCKSTTTTSELCSPVFKEVQPRPSEHSNYNITQII